MQIDFNTLASFIDSLKSIDTAILLAINGNHSLFWDNVMMGASGKLTWIPLYLVLAVLIIKEFGKKSWLPIIFAVLTVVVSDQASVHFAKDIFMRYRPSHNLIISPKLHIVNDYIGGMYGFVSSHASNTVSFAVFIMLLMPRKYIVIFLLCWAILVCYSRVYLGVHYPSDVIGGAILGTIVAWLMYTIYLISKRSLFKD